MSAKMKSSDLESINLNGAIKSYEDKAREHAEEIGVIEYKVNGNLMESLRFH